MDEGVIKFKLRHHTAPGPARAAIGPLEAWRRVLHRLTLIGQRPDRYAGLGFGNVSRRLPDRAGFLVSATQTGGHAALGPSGYCRVSTYNLQRHEVTAEGPLPPSSEALTHAALYAADGRIAWVFHGHSPEIWERRGALGIAETAAGIAYGTAEMAAAMADLAATLGPCGVFAMAGHRDGIIAYAPTAAEAGTAVVRTLADAVSAASDDLSTDPMGEQPLE